MMMMMMMMMMVMMIMMVMMMMMMMMMIIIIMIMIIIIIITTTTTTATTITTTACNINNNSSNSNNDNDDDDDDDDADDDDDFLYSKMHFEICYNLLTAPQTLFQRVRSSGQGAIVCKLRARDRALITCNTWCATWYEGTAWLLSLTDLKSHLFELYFIG